MVHVDTNERFLHRDDLGGDEENTEMRVGKFLFVRKIIAVSQITCSVEL